MKYAPLFTRLVLLAYLLLIAFFAFRPFRLIPGLQGNGQSEAMEDRSGGKKIRAALMAANRMTLEIELTTDSLRQGGPARIVSFSRDSFSCNFTLGQSGNGLVFRLRTTETDNNGVYPSLLVPRVFDTERTQHLAITYDGEKVQLYVDSKLHPTAIKLNGGFGNWGRGHLLTMRDEAPGGRSWNGQIERFSIYDRALTTEEIALLCQGGTLPGAVYAFHGGETGDHGMHPLNYRNLWVFLNPGTNWMDTILNIVGFMPMAPLIFLAFPERFRRRAFRSVFLIPVLSGFAVSGFIEFMQRGIDGRVPCPNDLMNNVLGTLFGSLLLWFVLPMVTSRVFNKGKSA